MQQLQAAVALHNQGELDQAAEIYIQVLDIDGDNFNALNLYGCALRSMGRHRDALVFLQRAVAARPEDVAARFNLGNAFRDLGMTHDSSLQYKVAVEINPSDASLLYEYAKSLVLLGNIEKAIVCYRRAIEVKPDFPDAYLNLGNVLKEKGEVEEAIVNYRMAIQVKSDFADAYFNLGNVLKEEGEVEEAIASYRNAIALKPNFADALYGLAEASEASSSSEEAIHSYRQNLEVKSEFLILKNSSLDFGFVDIPSNVISHIEDALPVGLQLIPSFNANGVLDEWSSLWHVHIPKTGGMRFYNPLMSLLQGIKDVGVSPCKRMFHVSRCHSPFELDAYRRILEDSVEHVDSCLVNVFSVEQDPLWDTLFNRINFCPKRIAFYRKPAERLKSALKYIYRINGCRLSAVEREIEMRHLHLDNPVVRALSGVFRREIKDDDLRVAFQKERVDFLLPLGDFALGSQIQSAFLSSNSLPNVILPRVINSTLKKYEPSEGEMDSLVELANSQGLNHWDEQLGAGIKMDDLEIDLPDKNVSLNEWTMIFSSEMKEEIHEGWLFVPTCEFLADPERWLPAEA